MLLNVSLERNGEEQKKNSTHTHNNSRLVKKLRNTGKSEQKKRAEWVERGNRLCKLFFHIKSTKRKKKIGEKNVHLQKSIKKEGKIHLTTYEICFGNVINLGLKAQEWRRLKYKKK